MAVIFTLATACQSVEAGRRTRIRNHENRNRGGGVEDTKSEFLEDLITTESRQVGYFKQDEDDLIAMEDHSRDSSAAFTRRVLMHPPSVQKKEEKRTGRNMRRPIRMRRPYAAGGRRRHFNGRQAAAAKRRKGHNDNIMTETSFAPHKVVRVVQAPKLGQTKPAQKSSAFTDLMKREQNKGSNIPITKVSKKPFKTPSPTRRKKVPRLPSLTIPRRTFQLGGGMNLLNGLNQVAQTLTQGVRPQPSRGRPKLPFKPKRPSSPSPPSSDYGAPLAVVVSSSSSAGNVKMQQPPRDKPMADPISIPMEKPVKVAAHPADLFGSLNLEETPHPSFPSTGFVPTAPRNNFADTIKDEIDSKEQLSFNIDTLNPTPYPIDKKDEFIPDYDDTASYAPQPNVLDSKPSPHFGPDIPRLNSQLHEEASEEEEVIALPFQRREDGMEVHSSV